LRRVQSQSTGYSAFSDESAKLGYQRSSPHAGLTGKTPLARYQQDLHNIRTLGHKAAQLYAIFHHRVLRKVRKDGTVSYQANTSRRPMNSPAKPFAWSSIRRPRSSSGSKMPRATTGLGNVAGRRGQCLPPTTAAAQPSIERERFAQLIQHAIKATGSPHRLLGDSGLELLLSGFTRTTPGGRAHPARRHAVGRAQGPRPPPGRSDPTGDRGMAMIFAILDRDTQVPEGQSDETVSVISDVLKELALRWESRCLHPIRRYHPELRAGHNRENLLPHRSAASEACLLPMNHLYSLAIAMFDMIFRRQQLRATNRQRGEARQWVSSSDRKFRFGFMCPC
jgi:hypothetical protein